MIKNKKEVIRAYLVESLDGTPHLDNPDKFSIGRHLLIRNNDTGIEYTVADINVGDSQNPVLTCYRYDPSEATTFYVDIEKEDFSKYSLA